MEIRQVLKSSASIIPVLFYKVSRWTKETRRYTGEEDRKGGNIEKEWER